MISYLAFISLSSLLYNLSVFHSVKNTENYFNYTPDLTKILDIFMYTNNLI